MLKILKESAKKPIQEQIEQLEMSGKVMLLRVCTTDEQLIVFVGYTPFKSKKGE